jgi:hypothetical protein
LGNCQIHTRRRIGAKARTPASLSLNEVLNAWVAKSVDAPALGAGSVRSGGSSPFPGTKQMDNRKLQKALHKTLDDLAPLIFLLAIIVAALVLVGLFVWLGFWAIPVLIIAAISISFLNNYFDLLT